MIITSSIAELRSHVAAARSSGASIGCVPTMGALHAGHVSLFEACRAQASFVVATIFVNPTQFGPGEDFLRYPRPVEADLDACRKAGVDAVFLPDVAALYPEGFCTYVTVEGLSTVLEGAIRPVHFRGVATVVTKLFHIVQPDVACFGAKDFQQQAIIRRMVRDLDLPIEIVVCPTIRESDGLALSSRNAYLSPEEREQALALWRSLQLAQRRLFTGVTDIATIQQEMLDHLREHPLVQPDYALIADPESLAPLDSPQLRMVALVAARVGTTRLIDNLTIELPLLAGQQVQRQQS